MVFLFQMRIIEIIFLPERSTEFESGNVIGAFVIIGQRKKIIHYSTYLCGFWITFECLSMAQSISFHFLRI